MKDIKNLSDKELKQAIREYDEAIYGDNACYGRSDMIYNSQLWEEADKRGLKLKLKIV